VQDATADVMEAIVHDSAVTVTAEIALASVVIAMAVTARGTAEEIATVGIVRDSAEGTETEAIVRDSAVTVTAEIVHASAAAIATVDDQEATRVARADTVETVTVAALATEATVPLVRPRWI
jgi:hypothetical protein